MELTYILYHNKHRQELCHDALKYRRLKSFKLKAKLQVKLQNIIQKMFCSFVILSVCYPGTSQATIGANLPRETFGDALTRYSILFGIVNGIVNGPSLAKVEIPTTFFLSFTMLSKICSCKASYQISVQPGKYRQSPHPWTQPD